jgi:hypothetical protein
MGLGCLGCFNCMGAYMRVVFHLSIFDEEKLLSLTEKMKVSQGTSRPYEFEAKLRRS